MHSRVRISAPGNFRLIDCLANLLLLLLCEGNINSAQVLLEILDLLCTAYTISLYGSIHGYSSHDKNLPRDGKDVVSLRQQPRQGQLSRRDALASGNAPNLVRQRQVLSKILLGEARQSPAEVVFGKVVRGLDLPRQHASSQGTVSDNRNAELPGRLEQANLRLLNVNGEGTVFDLNGGDGMDGMGAAKGGG